MGPIVLTQLGLSVLAGAALVKSVMDQKTMMGSGQFPRCSSCNGTGRVSCMCSRWSDGDVGCRTCAGSGRMACNSCGGTVKFQQKVAYLTRLKNNIRDFSVLSFCSEMRQR